MRLVDSLLRKGVKVFDICFWVPQTFYDSIKLKQKR